MDFKSSYDADTDNLRKDFYEPALKNAKVYKRASGFFSSSCFISWGRFIFRLYKDPEAKAQLIISPHLTDKDIKALIDSQEDQVEKIFEAKVDELLSGLVDEENPDVDDFSKIMCWLIVNGKLQIKFAVKKDNRGMYHRKIGIIEYDSENEIAFSGSSNESLYGHEFNDEVIDVFCSWKESDSERIENHKGRFERNWNGTSENCKIYDLSKESIKKLKTKSEELPPGFKSDDFIIDDRGNIKIKPGILPPPPPPPPPPFKLRPHQKKAVDNWKKNGYLGLFDMCTGAGKTVAALAGVKTLSENENLRCVIILCPTNLLVNQWKDEVKEFNLDKFKLTLPLTSNQKDWLDELDYSLKGNSDIPEVIIATYDSFIGNSENQRFLTMIKKHSKNGRKALLVADECHGVGSPSRKNTLEDDLVSNFFNWRLGLSATYIREGDEKGTKFIENYFSNPKTDLHPAVVAKYDLQNGLDDKVLCPFNYYPIIKYLDPDKSKEYWELMGSSKETDFKMSIRQVSLVALHDIFDHKVILKNGIDWTMVFAPIGRDPEFADTHYIDLTYKEIKKIKDDVLITHLYDSDNSLEERINGFRNKVWQILVGQKIFDEGVSINEVRNAIMMYSFNVEKQFIQRRGRVLRQSKNTGKKIANIFDVIIFPQNSDTPPSQVEYIINKEMRRYKNFCKYAKNGKDALKVIDNAINGIDTI